VKTRENTYRPSAEQSFCDLKEAARHIQTLAMLFKIALEKKQRLRLKTKEARK
jgi:hypothetical protein